MTEAVPAADTTFPVPRGCPFAEPSQYEELRKQAPVTRVPLHSGLRAWWISRHADVRAVLGDQLFSSDRRHENYPLIDSEVTRQRARTEQPAMINLDGEAHAAARRAVIGEFTVKRLAALRPRVQHLVDGLIDRILATEERQVDLVEMLSLPVPSMVICELIGVPYADHEFFQERSARMIRRATDSVERQRCVSDLREYLDRLLARKETEPGDDLLSRQIERQREAGGIRREELVSLAFLLLIAGHETTANMISLGVIGLLRHPDQLAVVKADPSRAPMAVEELLRYFSIVEMVTSRVATKDVEVGGVTIKAGDGVVTSGLSANWDPEVFANPDKLDIERGARHHLAFGFGPHQCLGQNLARQELQIVFDTVFRRIPGLRLATPVEDIPLKTDTNVYGVYRLPVTW